MKEKNEITGYAEVENGMIVFPEKSYVSKKLYIAIGRSYHQFGKPIKIVSY